MFNFIKNWQCPVRMALLFAGALSGLSAAADAPAKAPAYTVTIEKMQFSPKIIEINAGDSVIWNNADLVSHTITADTNAFNSGNIPVNRSWKFVARKKGTFSYTCTFHPGMKGTLIVK